MKEIRFGKVVELKTKNKQTKTKKKRSITKINFGESNPLPSHPR